MRDLKVSVDVSAVPARPAGAGRYTIELVSALGEREDTALALVCRAGDTQRWSTLAPTAALADVVPSGRPARLAYEQLALGRQLSKLGVDVHHGPHYTMPRRSPVPVVVTIHDLTFFDHPEVHECSKVFFFRRAIARAAVHADALVCVSERTATRLRQLFEVAGPVFTAPHGIDHARFSPVEPSPGADVAALTRLRLDPSRRRVVLIGTLEPRKGIIELLDAFEALGAEHPELDLVLAGQRGWGLDDVDARLSTSSVRDRIHLLGYVADDEVPALLRTASVVAYPSIDEGFGLPALEGLACGAPVVTTEGSVMAEICGSAPWLVAAGDAATLADGIARALGASIEERARRAKEGRETASGFTWAAAASVHREAYAAAVERGHSSRGK